MIVVRKRDSTAREIARYLALGIVRSGEQMEMKRNAALLALPKFSRYIDPYRASSMASGSRMGNLTQSSDQERSHDVIAAVFAALAAQFLLKKDTIMKRLLLQMVALAVLASSPALGYADNDKALPPPQAKLQEAKPQPAVRLGIATLAVAPSGPLRWARMPQVQEELKLSDEQKSVVNEAAKDLGAANRELVQSLRGLSADERAKKAPEIQKKFADTREEIEKKVRQSLKPEQVARLEQIDVQARGLRGLTQDDIAGKLKLTDEQRKKITDLQVDQQQKMQQLAQDVRAGKVERAKYREKFDEISKENEKHTMDVLTDEQRAAYEMMKGEKFEFGRGGVGAIQAIPVQPGQIRRIQIQPGRIQVQPKAVPPELD